MCRAGFALNIAEKIFDFPDKTQIITNSN